VTINRGEVGWSEEALAKRWLWSRGKVRRFLFLLKTVQQIEHQNSKTLSRIIILNYSKYQANGTTDGTTDGTNNKNVKKVKNIYTSNDVKKRMKWKKYNENQHTDEVPAIDLDSREVIKDKEALSREKERLLMEWAETHRGKRFLDRPTQLSFIKRLKAANLSPALIKRTYLELLQSDYWQEQLRHKGQLPDFKTVFSNLKNKHERPDD